MRITFGYAPPIVKKNGEDYMIYAKRVPRNKYPTYHWIFCCDYCYGPKGSRLYFRNNTALRTYDNEDFFIKVSGRPPTEKESEESMYFCCRKCKVEWESLYAWSLNRRGTDER